MTAAKPGTRRRPASGTVAAAVKSPTTTMVVRYAVPVSTSSATPASTVPRPMKTLVTTRSRARISTRSAPRNHRACSVDLADPCSDRPPTATQAIRVKATALVAKT